MNKSVGIIDSFGWLVFVFLLLVVFKIGKLI